MARTNRDRLTFHPEWIGKVPKVWITKPHKRQYGFRKRKFPKYMREFLATWWDLDVCKNTIRSAKRKSEKAWKREEDL